MTGKILKSASCIAVTLISKFFSPSTLKEYKPTTCCTTLYKIIAKILTNRSKLVINDIIGPS